MPPIPSALTPENTDFCNGVRAFCDEHQISLRRLSEMGSDGRDNFSKTSADRLLKLDTTNKIVDRIRPKLAAAFVTFLDDRGFLASEIEEELSHFLDPKEYIKMIANRCPLTPEAVRYFGLKTDPFDVDQIPGRDEVFTSPAIETVVARLKDAVLYQRFVAVIGGVGTGKTLLKLRVADELEGRSEPGAVATGLLPRRPPPPRSVSATAHKSSWPFSNWTRS